MEWNSQNPRAWLKKLKNHYEKDETRGSICLSADVNFGIGFSVWYRYPQRGAKISDTCWMTEERRIEHMTNDYDNSSLPRVRFSCSWSGLRFQASRKWDSQRKRRRSSGRVSQTHLVLAMQKMSKFWTCISIFEMQRFTRSSCICISLTNEI